MAPLRIQTAAANFGAVDPELNGERETSCEGEETSRVAPTGERGGCKGKDAKLGKSKAGAELNGGRVKYSREQLSPIEPSRKKQTKENSGLN